MPGPSANGQAPAPDAAPDPVTDPSALAARILQMHATSEAPDQPGCPAPKLIGAPEDPALDLPGILQRRTGPAAALRLDPATVPQPAPAALSGAARSGPGFVPLLASTVVIAALFGGGFYLYSASRADSDAQTRLVPTEEISAAPTIESLIAEDAAALDGTPPNAQQVARAKDRIRQAFHASGDVAFVPAGATPSSPVAAAASMMEEGKIQARLTPENPAAPGTRSPHAENTPFRVAGPAAEGALPASGTAGSASPSPSPTQSIAAAASFDLAEESSPPPAASASESAAASPAAASAASATYPHEGVISASVNMRQSDDKDAAVLTVIPAGTKVRYDACGAWWCGVAHQGQTGFVGQKFLTRSQ